MGGCEGEEGEGEGDEVGECEVHFCGWGRSSLGVGMIGTRFGEEFFFSYEFDEERTGRENRKEHEKERANEIINRCIGGE